MKIPGIATERLTKIFGSGSKLYYVTKEYSVKAIPNDESIVRVSIISGKKALGKSAVMRNVADRRVRAALQSTLSKYSCLKGKVQRF
jgi:ribonuclease P protein component